MYYCLYLFIYFGGVHFKYDVFCLLAFVFSYCVSPAPNLFSS